MNERIFVGTGEKIEDCNLVEFRLLYEGELLSSGNRPKPENKHAIRKQLHPQMRNLWQTRSSLRQYAAYLGNTVNPHGGTEDERIERGITSIADNWARAGYKFVPLVTEKFALRCSVEIVILRPDKTQVIHSDTGDLDGKVKTIFDALQVPINLEGLAGIPPEDDETPFYCLLADDKLISEVNVTADQLLALPGQKAPKASDSFVIIHVRINHIGGSPFDRWFD